ncbi:MAG: hypothetical protein M1822_003766 [Bathelium mastoideum]|nr:MAG: hypothetical protein M1822_003766 [Bathelium mastoideum]
MGSYLFKWDHPANEVYVTGTFDDWAQKEKMEKVGGRFEKLVQLPKTDEKIYYKFVADGNWTTDHTAPSERDNASNINNVLHPENITPATISSVAPNSSTAQMAANVPRESESLPGAFPETPANEVNQDSALNSSAKDAEQTFGVAPIPATAGPGNPIQLKPGEPVPDPSTLTSNTVGSTAKTDKASYEQSSSAAPQNSVGGTGEQLSTQGGMFGVPPVTSGIIPESSLPMGSGTASERDPGVTVSSAAPTSTTAQLAGQVPKEPKGVPEVVTDSQEKAHVDPEASAQANAVNDKKAVEEELQSKVPEQKPTSESGWSTGKLASMAGGAAAAVAGAAYAAKDKLPTSVQQSIDQMNLTTKERATDDHVPDVVTDSQKAANESPEAATNPTAVAEKAQVENELLQNIHATDAAGEPAPTSAEASALSATAPTHPTTADSSALSSASLATDEPLKSSTEVATPGATDAAATEKKDPEPADIPAVASAGKANSTNPSHLAVNNNSAANAVDDEPEDRSRDVSPMSKPPTRTVDTATQQDQPTVTTGVGEATAPTTSSAAASSSTPSTPAKAKDAAKDKETGTPASGKSAGGTSKKDKRRSFFGKIKDKLSSDKEKK